jgi:hypothetical protein
MTFPTQAENIKRKRDRRSPVPVEVMTSEASLPRLKTFLRQYAEQVHPMTGEVVEGRYLIRLACPIDLPAPEVLVTLGEWLEQKGTNLGKQEMARYSRIVAASYKALYGGNPKTVRRKGSTGHWNLRAYGYDPIAHNDLLSTALRNLRRGTFGGRGTNDAD